MKRVIFVFVGGLVSLVSAWCLGALVSSLFSHRLAGSIAAAAIAVVLCFVAPFWFDRKLLAAARKSEPDAKSTLGQMLLIWDGILLAVALFAVPKWTRPALETHGDWLFFNAEEPSEAGAWLQAVRRVTPYLPRSVGAPLPPEAETAAKESGTTPQEPPDKKKVDAGVSEKMTAAKAVTIDQAAAVASEAAAKGSLAPGETVDGPADVFRRYADSVVIVEARKKMTSEGLFGELRKRIGLEFSESFGSGFIVSDDGLIITNEHVIRDAGMLNIRLRDGRHFSRVTRLVVSRTHDLALLKVEGTDLPPVPLAEDDAVGVGDPAIAIGNPLGLEYTLTSGIVSAFRKQNNTHMIQMQTTVAPGSSGGPLFSNNGEIIGVNTNTRGAGLNHAVRVQHVREILAETRKPKAYDPYEGGIRVTHFASIGIETDPTERSNLMEGFRMLGTMYKACLGEVPEAAYITFRYSSKGGFESPQMDTNIEAQLQKCRMPFADMILTQATAALVDAHADLLKDGFQISVQVVGFKGEGTEPSTVTLTLRFGHLSPPDAGAR